MTKKGLFQSLAINDVTNRPEVWKNSSILCGPFPGSLYGRERKFPMDFRAKKRCPKWRKRTWVNISTLANHARSGLESFQDAFLVWKANGDSTEACYLLIIPLVVGYHPSVVICYKRREISVFTPQHLCDFCCCIPHSSCFQFCCVVVFLKLFFFGNPAFSLSSGTSLAGPPHWCLYGSSSIKTLCALYRST